MIGFIIATLLLLGMFLQWHKQAQAHEARLEQLPIRIHVNGIRGKSTVTRLIAAVLREGGYRTVAKTTGSAARIILEDGNELPIARRGAPTITEQIDIIKQHTKPNTDALVIECMAVNPLYQHVSQHQIVKGNITVITNVREDHQDVMGHTLPEIANALSNTIPVDGVLISAETRPELREQLANNAVALNSGFRYADPTNVNDEDIQAFSYLTFKENVAIGLTIAEMYDIPREVALQGMRRALPDIGAVAVERKHLDGKELIWAPLFAVNDRESTIASIDALKKYHRADCTRIGILNNRVDRAVRALKFAEIAADDLKLDYYITFGAYEKQVADLMVEHGYPRERIIHLGFSRNPSESEILQAVLNLIDGTQGMLIGMVNIHTPQAELLMEYFEHSSHHSKSKNQLLVDQAHISSIALRQRELLSRLLNQEPSHA